MLKSLTTLYRGLFCCSLLICTFASLSNFPPHLSLSKFTSTSGYKEKPTYQIHIICLLCKHGKRAYLTTIFPLFFVCMVEQKSKLPVLFGRRKKGVEFNHRAWLLKSHPLHSPFFIFNSGWYSKSHFFFFLNAVGPNFIYLLECFTNAHCNILYFLSVICNRTLFRFLCSSFIAARPHINGGDDHWRWGNPDYIGSRLILLGGRMLMYFILARHFSFLPCIFTHQRIHKNARSSNLILNSSGHKFVEQYLIW